MRESLPKIIQDEGTPSLISRDEIRRGGKWGLGREDGVGDTNYMHSWHKHQVKFVAGMHPDTLDHDIFDVFDHVAKQVRMY